MKESHSSSQQNVVAGKSAHKKVKVNIENESPVKKTHHHHYGSENISTSSAKKQAGKENGQRRRKLERANTAKA